jgi:hypothetical protein
MSLPCPWAAISAANKTNSTVNKIAAFASTFAVQPSCALWTFHAKSIPRCSASASGRWPGVAFRHNRFQLLIDGLADA